jgi:hypothetical protein
MAQDYWPGGALGHRLQLPGEKKMRVVVGIARTANYTSWGEPPQPCIYLPLAQADPEAMVLYVRTKADPREILAPVEREMRAAAPQILLFGIRTGGEVIDGGLFQARMGVGLLATFGLGLRPRRHRLVWCDGVLGESAPPRNRSPHGTRRHTR